MRPEKLVLIDAVLGEQRPETGPVIGDDCGRKRGEKIGEGAVCRWHRYRPSLRLRFLPETYLKRAAVAAFIAQVRPKAGREEE